MAAWEATLMRGNVSANIDHRCPSCLLHPEWCYCSRVPELQVKTRLVIVRHYKERFRTSNTARLVQQAIPGTLLLDYGAPDHTFDPTQIPEEGAGLLFPEGQTSDVSPSTLVVVDGSWPQARRMIRRVPQLAALPRLTLTPPKHPPRRIRRPPQPEGMATIEAVARALDHLEGPGTGAPLDAVFADMVDTLHRLRGKVRPRG